MWIALFRRFMNRLIAEGHLVVMIGDGPPMTFGNPAEPKVTVRIKDSATVRRLLLDPELALGECYTDGALTVDGDDIQALMEVALRNSVRARDVSLFARVNAALRQMRKGRDLANNRTASKRNVAHHYDLTPAIYDLFLDTDPYNAHTTASDALWAGCPVLTAPGRTFAARVAGSLNHHLGMAAMNVADDDAFVARAIALGNDPAALATLRAELALRREGSGVFDMAGFAGDFTALATALARAHGWQGR